MKKKRIIVLQNWSPISSPTNPPEFMYMRGVSYNHPFYNDGTEVITSPVQTVKGRFFITMSGNKYRLGKIDPIYRHWLKVQYPLWDYRYPLR